MSRLLFVLLLVPQTKIVQLHDKEIVRRGNFVVAATVDGYICHGTHEPLSVSCHRAVTVSDEIAER
ncbi:MAG TPA: hypothetical protein VMS18_16510 [Candidatus Binatia bacterium]|nr:hypothetical protein [Candidatus Binatia bacterium]